MDKDNNGIADMWVIQWEVSNYAPTGEKIWIETTFDDSSLVHVYGGPSGYGQPATKTLGDLKAETGYSDYKILEAKLMFGYFSTGLPDMTALVDDITINGVLYHFDNRSFFVPGTGKGLDKGIPNENFAKGRREKSRCLTKNPFPFLYSSHGTLLGDRMCLAYRRVSKVLPALIDVYIY